MRRRILFVDDDPNFLASLKRQLYKQIDVELAFSGDEAIERITADQGFDLVICDQKMPGLDGVDTLARIRDIAPGILRIILTGRIEHQAAVDAINDAGVVRYLNKPFAPKRLLATIKEVLVKDSNSEAGEAPCITQVKMSAIPEQSVLAEDIFLDDGTLLLGAGNTVSQTVRRRLVKYSQEKRIPNEVRIELV